MVASTTVLLVGSRVEDPLLGLKKRTRLTAISPTNPKIRTLLVRSKRLSCLSMYVNLFQVFRNDKFELREPPAATRGQTCDQCFRQSSAVSFLRALYRG